MVQFYIFLESTIVGDIQVCLAMSCKTSIPSSNVPKTALLSNNLSFHYLGDSPTLTIEKLVDPRYAPTSGTVKTTPFSPPAVLLLIAS
mmetsp:Transcript_13874/g.17457  ORF Transcript_13874/g.17457 Transcript_13874/m.17457 type:complete len:88 (-) Transcript_13874:793-1056(-)